MVPIFYRGVPTSTQIRMCVQLDAASIVFFSYNKTCLKQPLKIRQKKILMTNGSILQYFRPSVSDNKYLKTKFWSSF